MSAGKQFQRSFKVGKYHCTATTTIVAGQPLAVGMEWTPDVPRNFSPGWFAEYQRKRNAVMAALSDEVGGVILMVDA